MNIYDIYYNLILEENELNDLEVFLNNLDPSKVEDAKKILKSPLVKKFAEKNGIIKESSDKKSEISQQDSKSNEKKSSILKKIKIAIKTLTAAGVIGVVGWARRSR